MTFITLLIVIAMIAVLLGLVFLSSNSKAGNNFTNKSVYRSNYTNKIKHDNVNKNNIVSLSVEVRHNPSVLTEWDKYKLECAEKTKEIKNKFHSISDIDEVFRLGEKELEKFILNHNIDISRIRNEYNGLIFPSNIKLKEISLRKQLNESYKKRADYFYKCLAIYIAWEHYKLTILNSEFNWKTLTGIKRLISNWKCIEHIETLLILIYLYKDKLLGNEYILFLNDEIENIFTKWGDEIINEKNFNIKVDESSKCFNSSDKHFLINDILKYLERRSFYNPSFTPKIIDWCLIDISIYEDFLKIMHYYDILSIDDEIYLSDKEKAIKYSAFSFEDVKQLNGYFVPRLPSFDLLKDIFTKENDLNKLSWLNEIGNRIGYQQVNLENIDSKINIETVPESIIKNFDYTSITSILNAPASNQKGKFGFLNDNGLPCSTEDIFQESYRKIGWNIIRGEVSFWQAMFCLSFWEEIDFNSSKFSDIPIDLFNGIEFYTNRKDKIDIKYNLIKSTNINKFINEQINLANGTYTRLLYEGEKDMIHYAKSNLVQIFLSKIDSKIFAKIVYRIAQNPNENRAGLPDFAIWNDSEFKLIEVKKNNESLREGQKIWTNWMINENIPIEIVRVKPILNKT